MYEVHFHKLVLIEDFKLISKTDQNKIVKAINKKLSLDPESFGKPLIANLKGYYRLRVGDFRVIYKINKKEIIVYIVKVGLRKDFIVYLEAAKRLRLI